MCLREGVTAWKEDFRVGEIQEVGSETRLLVWASVVWSANWDIFRISAFAVPPAWNALPCISPWPGHEQGHVRPSPSLVPSLWQRPGFHTPLSQLHEAHASPQALPELWFSQEFRCQPGVAPRCAGRQGKQEVSSWPGHRQQARWALSGHRLH